MILKGPYSRMVYIGGDPAHQGKDYTMCPLSQQDKALNLLKYPPFLLWTMIFTFVQCFEVLSALTVRLTMSSDAECISCPYFRKKRPINGRWHSSPRDSQVCKPIVATTLEGFSIFIVAHGWSHGRCFVSSIMNPY